MIESDVSLPELLPAEAGTAIDLSVHVCAVLPQAPALQDLGGGWAVGETTIRFQVSGVGAFQIHCPCNTAPGWIDVAPTSGARPSDIRLFLLGSAIGAFLHQRGMLPLHAAGLETAHGCIAIAGDSGAGKSTLAAFLRQRSLRSLCDDVLAVEPRSGLAWPGYPQAKLWGDAARALAIKTEGCERVDLERDKYRVPLAVPAQFRATPQFLTRLYVLAEEAGPLRVEAVNGAAALAEITRNTYRPFLIGALGRAVRHFEDIAALSSRVRVFRLVRPRGFGRMAEVVDTLAAHVADGNP